MRQTSCAELLGSPSIEYMLCGAATRLAQSKGLHREPSAAWRLPESEILHRQCIFWTIYCYDKALALRCGRPSVSPRALVLTKWSFDFSCQYCDQVWTNKG